MKKFISIFTLILLALQIHGAVIFQSNMDSATTVSQVFTNDVNIYGNISVAISTAQAHSGTKSVRIIYNEDEAGVELKPEPFTSTPTLFIRKYEYYDSAWQTNWPVGLKTSRYFTLADFTIGTNAYCSEKLIWQTYGGDPSDLYGRGLNCAIFDLDLEDTYGSGELFGNGLPYIRTGRWYQYETYLVLNSAPDVADGRLAIWIDNVKVYDNTATVWRSNTRGCPNGTGWQSMWFGGNYSGAVFGGPSTPVTRYIDDVYLSTTLDLAGEPSQSMKYVIYTK